MQHFTATIELIGVNPYVFVPEALLQELFRQSGKTKGPIPIRGTLNGQTFKQTLVRYAGHWRLYINMLMLKNSPQRIGELVELAVEFDPADRSIAPHPELLAALAANPEAQRVFDTLSPSLRREIVRYIAGLKSPESVERNIGRAIAFLLGNGRFVGRDRPERLPLQRNQAM